MVWIRRHSGLTGIIATLPGGKERAIHLVNSQDPTADIGVIFGNCRGPMTISKIVTLVPPQDGVKTLVTNKMEEWDVLFRRVNTTATDGVVETCEEITAAYVKAGFDPEGIKYAVRPTTLKGKLRQLLGMKITG